MEINNFAIIIIECLCALFIFHNSACGIWFNSCWVSMACIEFIWSWGAQQRSDSRQDSGKGIQNVFSAMLLHRHSLCNPAFFFSSLQKIIAVITANRNVEYGPLNICYKMLFFFFLCLFFFIKLKACLMGEMCSNVRGQWEDRVRQEGLKVIAWSVRAKSPLIFKARYKSGFFFCFSPN